MEKGFDLCNGMGVKEGEKILKSLQNQSQYPEILFRYLEQNMQSPGKETYVLRAMIELKNWSEKYKDMEMNEQLVVRSSVDLMEQNIVNLLMNTRVQVKSVGGLLIQVVHRLASVDYPATWTAFPLQVMSALNLNDL